MPKKREPPITTSEEALMQIEEPQVHGYNSRGGLERSHQSQWMRISQTAYLGVTLQKIEMNPHPPPKKKRGP